jgi:Brp/Blh family beta-carotene 15,15'-monooxygenase
MDSFLKGGAQHHAAKASGVMKLTGRPSSDKWLERSATAWIFPGITLLLVLATSAGASVNEPIILIILTAGVVCLGLPHGSLDPLVARKLYGANRRFTMLRFLAAYTLIAALCAAGWIAAPGIALPIFLVISALHFGSDWQQRGSPWGRAAYGACVVTLPTLHHAETVRRIYLALGATNAAGIVGVSVVVAWIVAALAVLSLLPRIKGRWRDGIELAVLLIGGVMLPPLVFFVCYFCLLHSPRHLWDTSRTVGISGIRAVAAAVAPTVAATLVFAAVLWHFLPSGRSHDRVLELVFVGLAALTVPHMLLTEMKDFA